MRTAAHAKQVKVALFCGGRGSATIIREFLRQPDVELTLLVNAYDDGLSTGALRKFIPGMLGPSDFRKNLSYLLDLYSDQQYALRSLVELRLSAEFGKADEAALRTFVRTESHEDLDEQFVALVKKLDPPTLAGLRRHLGIFLDYAQSSPERFDFRDCSVGNLIFAGAYLENGRNFNAAVREIGRLVDSQAVLVNVSNGENRILAGLKADGQLLPREADVVGVQSEVPIVDTFFLESAILPHEWDAVSNRSLSEKVSWLKQREAPIQLSPEARYAIEQADIIVYGPGTQHSSLLPSYRIASDALRRAPAKMKAFVTNLEPDNDIQQWTVESLVDQALRYAGDSENRHQAITHVLINNPGTLVNALRFSDDSLAKAGVHRGASLIVDEFGLGDTYKVHNGYALVQKLLDIWEDDGAVKHKPSLRIFVDLFNRTSAAQGLIEEFLEISWSDFSKVCLRFNVISVDKRNLPPNVSIETTHHRGSFPEVSEVKSWIDDGDTDFLVTLIGDGEYRFGDVKTSVAALRDSIFGAVYGSRTQSRRQFNSSLRAAYGEQNLLFWLSRTGAFLLTVLFVMRFGLIFSDPLTGFRVYRRKHVECLAQLKDSVRLTPASISKQLIANYVEIAELPVRYRTFKGFSKSRWRLKRGFLNLVGLMS
ncbi:2-phospho-L-lactate transferase CofD family protein [Bradyrhizobium sp. C-145]|uniref:2-phospho-L-lactate transferase CofD family protein n=1 Tax=Bradyrhizobium sp. C-145 TaxID=574727 RepID=UPI00201B5277|nr:2-phospho-L-lactate transferase CofD family protein [Bradyrhizobium sp. C-145]UQR61351.1 2-phospho-L-lactate transferase CofD family protein [Bradyrhizobium sp. C-145]